MQSKKRRLKVLVLYNEVEIEPEADAEASFGGEPPEFESVEPAKRSRADLRTVVGALEAAGHHVTSVNLDDDIDRLGHAVVVVRPHIVLSVVEQMWGDHAQPAAVCQLLDLYGYPYIGSDPLALATTQERARTHVLLADAGIAVPGFVVVRDVNAIPDTSNLSAPLIVTQAFDDTYELEGQSHPLVTRDELEARTTELATEYDLPLLVEEFVDGRRLHAIVVGNRVLDVKPLIERRAEDGSSSEVAVVAQLDIDTAGRIRQLAIRTFQALGLRDFAQIDFALDHDNHPYVIDVRPWVDLSEGSVFHAAGAATELGLDGLIQEVAQTAVGRAAIKLELPPEPAHGAPEPTPESPADAEPAADEPTTSGQTDEAAG